MDGGWLQQASTSWLTVVDGNQTSYDTDDQQPVQIMNGGGTEAPISFGYSLTETVLISVVLLVFIVGTIVGNILVCTAVCLVRRLRRPCNYLLVSLAVSDLCVALLVMPMALVYEVLGTWPFGARICDTWVAFDQLSCTASILNLCMISVDRYWAITRPLDYGVKRTPGRMCCCVALVWISSACISLPPLLVLGNEHGQEGDEQCQVCQEFGYQIYATLGSFYIPLAVMAAVYYQIFQAAKRIVDEEKKAQSHLLMTRSAAETTVMVLQQQQQQQEQQQLLLQQQRLPPPSLLVQHQNSATTTTTTTTTATEPSTSSVTSRGGSNSSRCNSSGLVVVRRHGDAGGRHNTRSSMDSSSNNSNSWTNSNGRPTTWPDVCSSSIVASSKKEQHNRKQREHRRRDSGREEASRHDNDVTQVAIPASAAAGTGRHTSLDIPRCPRRRYSSSASTDIHDTSFETSMNNIAGNSVSGSDHHHSPSQSAVGEPPDCGAGARQSLLPSKSHRASAGPLVHHHHHHHHGATGRGSRVRLRFALNKERKASTTLGIIMSAFTLCWFPFFVLALARPFVSQPDLVIPRWLSSLFLWLGYANSFLNPVIYATTNKDFRLPFREILCLRCKSLNSVMREDFYQSQYGNEANKTALALAAAAAVASSSSSSGHKSHDANHHHYGHHHLRSADHRIGGGGDDDDDVPATRANSAAAFL